MTSYSKKSIIISQGRRIFYHVYAKKSGMLTVIMLHGFSENSFIWLKTVDQISQKMNCDFIIPDLSGHGFSDWRKDGIYNITNYTHDIEMLINELKLHSLILIGHSMGGTIVQELAVKLLPIIKGIILVDSCPSIYNSNSASCILDNFVKSISRSWTIIDYKNFIKSTRPFIPENELDWFVMNLLHKVDGSYSLRADPKIADQNKDIINIKSDSDYHKILFEVPLSIIRGQYSSFVTDNQAKKYLSYFIYNSYFCVPNAGHGLIIENNSYFNRVLYESLCIILKINNMDNVFN